MNILSPFRYIKCLFYPRISPLITVHIDEAALLHNLREYRQAYPDIQFALYSKAMLMGMDLFLLPAYWTPLRSPSLLWTLIMRL